MRVALVHDWLTGMRGGEKCLEVFCELFPDADLYTLVCIPEKISETINRMKIHTSFLQKIPGIGKTYRYFLPLMPHAIERFNLKGYDLVVSLSHCVAKGVKIEPQVRHICYCFTPMRYVWDMYSEYIRDASFVSKAAMRLFCNYLRKWDLKSAGSVSQFIAISEYVGDRIKKIYDRDSDVVYPPVDTDKYFYVNDETKEDYYILAGAFAAYKRVDLAVKAFNQNGRKLLIVGSGQEFDKVRKTAGGNIKFLGWVGDGELRRLYAKAKALIFPSEEDFGIVPVEAMACGTSVIAYGKGGAKETVIDGKTGLFFEEQSVESLNGAVLRFENLKFDKQILRNHALSFCRNRFKEEILRIFKAEFRQI